MKSLVTYYSYSGNTDNVAKRYKEALEKKGTAEISRLVPEDEITSFFGKCSHYFFSGFSISGR